MKRLLTVTATVSLAAFLGCGGGGGGSETAPVNEEALMDPKSPAMNQQAPDKFDVEFKTNTGNFVVSVNRSDAPLGADRFFNLVNAGFYNECRFFRVVPNFMAQFGFHGDPGVSEVWFDAHFPDDPATLGNKRGTITFATRGAGTRTTQLFINFKDNDYLDKKGFSAFGTITSGMEIVDSINSEYGEQPSQQQIGRKGNHYLKKLFPNLDYIIQARVVE